MPLSCIIARSRIPGEDFSVRKLVEQNRVASLAIDDRNDDVTRAALLEHPDEFGQIGGADQRQIARNDEHGIEAAIERLESRTHRALLARRVSLVMHGRHTKALHLVFDRALRMSRHNDDLVDAGAAQGDELPADQRHSAQANQRLRNATYAPALTGREQHRANAQSWIQAATLFS
jgi:hypothetical protein